MLLVLVSAFSWLYEPKLAPVWNYLNSKMEFNIKGVLAPVFTPMNDAGSINYDVIPEYAQYLVSNNIAGILVGGTTGEAASLNLAERKQLLAAWMKAAKPLGVSVISQVGAAPLPDVIELAKFSEEVQADAIMTLPELYYKPRNVEQLVTYLQTVSEAAPSLPLVYYHFPMMSGVDMNMREFFATAKARIENFKGMKADLNVALQVAGQFDRDQRVFIANHHVSLAAFMGQDSSIATVTNLFPMKVLNMVAAAKRGDVDLTRSNQMKMNEFVDIINSYGDFVPAMKVAMEALTGVMVGPPRQPLTPLNQLQISLLKKELDEFELNCKWNA